MVTATSARKPVVLYKLEKEFKDSFRTIIIVSSDACNKARVAIYKAMDNNLVSD